MNKVQRDIYEFLVEKQKISIFVAEDYRTCFDVKQIFDYLNIDALLFPDFRANKFDDLRSYKDELFEIFNILDKYYSFEKEDRPTIIIPQQTYKNPLPSKNLREPFKIRFGNQIDIEDFSKKLKYFGFSETGVVQNLGEFSISNNVIDIFPINHKSPLRIRLAENFSINKISTFSQFSQISNSDDIKDITIVPTYFSLSENRYFEILNQIQDENFNSFLQDIPSFGLWFLKSSEKLNLSLKHSIFTPETIPPAKKMYDIELEERKRKQSYQKSDILLDELSKGDYVVHLEYGIGIFETLTKETFFGGIRDFIKIKYFGENHLLLPIEKLNLLSRYISATGKTPKIDKLGKGGFQRKSEKVRVNIEKIVRYIAEISAKRKLLNSPRIKKVDLNRLQKEAGFKYTQDQNVSIKKILENLDSTTPMDHLLIGDVGFGKTEIAINAIFSVIKNGFQVAFVVPTTLLAKQHFSTIQKRFQNFGIEIAHIDKFVKAKERRETTQKVKEGKIDLVIGTHTILDFEFHKLALLIIDEEHKFGVKQKTKLQEKYSNIHLLSMSATPIPRTLNQALSKLKTTSRLEQSPKGRIPIKTFLREFDEVILKDAILKELKRDGQVFYIFNSIQDIENKKVEILNVLPHIKILVLHSKISPRIMEVEILRFEKGEYDVLLSTTIIGTGIHIPNVNTMIIDDAEKFGMADLHQLRGRVGRGKNEGFCYFFVEDMSKLRNMENASKRLLALEEHSSLGAGSSLAMHDLEIRGGGNIVGENQSGHIDDIGYSLYVQILEEELKKVTFQGGEEKKQIDIQLSIEAFISPLVVSDERAKLEIYRRTTNAKTTDEVEKIQNELKDRFGQLDVHTNQFFDLIKIRILGENIGVKSVSNMQKNISIIFHNGNRDVLVSPTRDDDDILETVLNFLSEFQN